MAKKRTTRSKAVPLKGTDPKAMLSITTVAPYVQGMTSTQEFLAKIGVDASKIPMTPRLERQLRGMVAEALRGTGELDVDAWRREILKIFPEARVSGKAGTAVRGIFEEAQGRSARAAGLLGEREALRVDKVWTGLADKLGKGVKNGKELVADFQAALRTSGVPKDVLVDWWKEPSKVKDLEKGLLSIAKKKSLGPKEAYASLSEVIREVTGKASPREVVGAYPKLGKLYENVDDLILNGGRNIQRAVQQGSAVAPFWKRALGKVGGGSLLGTVGSAFGGMMAGQAVGGIIEGGMEGRAARRAKESYARELTGGLPTTDDMERAQETASLLLQGASRNPISTVMQADPMVASRLAQLGEMGSIAGGRDAQTAIDAGIIRIPGATRALPQDEQQGQGTNQELAAILAQIGM